VIHPKGAEAKTEAEGLVFRNDFAPIDPAIVRVRAMVKSRLTHNQQSMQGASTQALNQRKTRLPTRASRMRWPRWLNGAVQSGLRFACGAWEPLWKHRAHFGWHA